MPRRKGCRCIVCTRKDVWAFIDELKGWAGTLPELDDDGDDDESAPTDQETIVKENFIRYDVGRKHFDLIDGWLRAWTGGRPTRCDAALVWDFMQRVTGQDTPTILRHLAACRLYSAWPHLMTLRTPLSLLDELCQQLTKEKIAHTLKAIRKGPPAPALSPLWQPE